MNGDIQRIQTAYRRRILDCWKIPPGSTVLEIGCGQGDMTAVLAEGVGPEGRVVAIDSARRDYGSPLNLGQATDIIKASELGDRIDFRFECDLLGPEVELGQFDYAVMAHCSWYFASKKGFMATLQALAKHAPKLCFAEWDKEPKSPEQQAHHLAVLILGLVVKQDPNSLSNVRNPWSIQEIWRLLSESGWYVSQSDQPDTSDLQDADWEISECLDNTLAEATALGFSVSRLADFEREIEQLRRIARPSGNVPLGSVALIAERRSG